MEPSSLGQKLERVHALFLDSFDKQSLRELLLFNVSQTLTHEVSEGDNFRTVVFNLLEKARKEGWLLDLVSKARDARPLRKADWDEVMDVLKPLGRPQIYRDALRNILSNISPKDTGEIFTKHLDIDYSKLISGTKVTQRVQRLIEHLEKCLLQSEFVGVVLRHMPDRSDLEQKYRHLAPKDVNQLHSDQRHVFNAEADLSLSRPIKVSRYRKQEIFDAEAIANVAFSPLGDLLAYSLDDNLMLLPINDPFPLPMPDSIQNAYSLTCTVTRRITDISFSPDGKYVATSHNNGCIRIWIVANRDLFTEIDAHMDEIAAISFSSNGRYLASAGLDEIVKVWEFHQIILNKFDPWKEFTKKSKIKKLARNPHDIERYFSLSFSPNGEHLASGDQQGVVVIRDLKSSKEVFRHKLHNHTVNSMAFSPSPSFPGLLASCSDDTRILLTDFMKESKPTTLGVLNEKHTKPVSSISFSYKGDILVSSGHDGSIRLWDIHSRRLLKIEEIEVQKPIQKVAFFPNKYDFATGCYSSDISLWNISNEGVITQTKVETSSLKEGAVS